MGNGEGPTSPYALQKLVTEIETEIYSKVYGLDTVSLRYFNVYSEDQPFGGSYEEGYSWARDIPVTDATKVVKYYNDLGYKSFQIKGEKQIAIEGAEGLTKPIILLKNKSF